MIGRLFKPKALDLIAPLSGTVVSLDQVKDPVFSERMMGDGFALTSIQGPLVSPVTGEVVALFPTLHAIGIKGDDRNEYLIHLGIDTVNLKGQGFHAHVAMGDTVSQGDLLIDLDYKFLHASNVDLTTMVLITNLNGRRVQLLKENQAVNVVDKEIIAIKN